MLFMGVTFNADFEQLLPYHQQRQHLETCAGTQGVYLQNTDDHYQNQDGTHLAISEFSEIGFP